MHWCAQIAAESPLCWMANIAMQAPLLLSGRLTNPLAANLAPDLNNEKVLARVGQLSYLHIHEPSVSLLPLRLLLSSFKGGRGMTRKYETQETRVT